MTHTLPALVLALALGSPAGQRKIKVPIVAQCTPTTVKIGHASPRADKHPIATALAAAGPGSVISLAPGTYASFGIGFGHSKPWNARTSGGTANQPILIHAPDGGVKIAASPDQGDTIAIQSDTNPGYITFQNLTIVPGYRAGVIFYKGKWGVSYEGFRFLDCDIVGSWDHVADRGGKSKWGLWAVGLKDFEFRGVQRRVRVENIRLEHGFYIQNPQGELLIENVDGKLLGRTFCQFTARASDGPPGAGTITIRNCRVEDAGIAKTDDYKGGSAMTFSGRLTGKIVLENNVIRSGFDPAVRKLTKPGRPFGTSGIVFWDYKAGPNGHVVLDGNDVEFFSGCGDRPLVSIGACQAIEILGSNRFYSGGDQPAIALDPPDLRDRSQLQNTPNGQVHVASGVALSGGIRIRGRMIDPEERARLAAPLRDS